MKFSGECEWKTNFHSYFITQEVHPRLLSYVLSNASPTARPKGTVLGLLWRESGVEQCQVTPIRQVL